MNTRNYTSDFFRCFFTIIIVVHHLHVPGINHGYLGVEFFFMLSGYFLMQIYDKNYSTLSALDYTKRRLKKLYPHYLFSFIMFFIYKYAILCKDLGVDDLFKSIPEMLLIQKIGIFKGSLNYPSWYLSVLIIGGYFLYYAISKSKDDFVKFFAPMIIIFTYTLLVSDGKCIEDWTTKGFIYMPLLRGLADMCVGIIIYEICKVKNRTEKKNNGIFYLMEIISFTGILYILIAKNNYDMYAILFIIFLIYSCFNKESIIYKFLNLKVFGNISKYMYPIYLNHALFVSIHNKLNRILNYKISLVITLIGLVIYSIITYKIVNKISEKVFVKRKTISHAK